MAIHRQGDSEAAAEDLRAAWDDLIEELQKARDAIDPPARMPPPPSPRNLAEGGLPSVEPLGRVA